MQQGPAIKNKNGLPFVAFMKDDASCDATRALAGSNGWPEGCVHYGDVRQAIVYLKEKPSPQILLVEIPSAAEAPELLDKLADVCTPDMRVIVAGSVNEFSFYSWLRSIGIEQYLLQPFTGEALQEALRSPDSKKAAAEEPKQAGTLIALMGARGGVGTTTVTTNLAYMLAKEYGQKTALLDMDPYFGTVAMAYDIQPGHGLRDALEKPDRIDDLFLDRVMVHHGDNLAILSGEEAFKQMLPGNAAATETLLWEMRSKYAYVLVDLPRTLTPLTRSILTQADHTILVSELSLLSLRDLLRLRDYIKGELHRPEPIVVANREGLASRYELKKASFEKNYGRPVDVHLPCMMEAFKATSSGVMVVETTKNSVGLEALHTLAEKVLGEEMAVEPKKSGNMLLKLMGEVSDVWKTRH